MRKHRKLTNANSCCLDAKWIDSPDTWEMTDRQFREGIRLAVALWSSTRRLRSRQRVFMSVTTLWGRVCAYCGSSDGPFELEHITPLARGGSNAMDNLTVSCKPCNRKKHTKTAAEFGFPEVHARAKALNVETETGQRTKQDQTAHDGRALPYIERAMGDHKRTSATD